VIRGASPCGCGCRSEVSRFARNSREWQQLVEVCRIVDTVLIDQETVYAPRASNDRLLLGLKGSLNEYELGASRQRSAPVKRIRRPPKRSFSTRFLP
jgi:DNA invertase Pin-like site-specific DNA recombinase